MSFHLLQVWHQSSHFATHTAVLMDGFVDELPGGERDLSGKRWKRTLLPLSGRFTGDCTWATRDRYYAHTTNERVH